MGWTQYRTVAYGSRSPVIREGPGRKGDEGAEEDDDENTCPRIAPGWQHDPVVCHAGCAGPSCGALVSRAEQSKGGPGRTTAAGGRLVPAGCHLPSAEPACPTKPVRARSRRLGANHQQARQRA
nr:hypothetical protein CFP56_11366 [Quercus suber]